MMFLLRPLLALAALRKPLLSRVMAVAGQANRASRAIGAALLLLAAPWAIAQQSVTFNYTGAVQTFTMPPGVWDVQIQAFGAGGGGGGSDNPGNGGAGGRGEGASVIYPLGPGSVMNMIVGGGGSGAPGEGVACNTSGGAGGLAGGAGGLPGGKGGNRGCYGYSGAGGGGGAATVLTSPSGFVMLAAGGGGGGQGGSLNLPGRDGLTGYTPGSAYSNLGPITESSGHLPADAFSCAPQGGTCSFSGIKEVWYGSDDAWSGWAVFPASSSAPCDHNVLGDPNYGNPKSCYYREYTGSWTPSVPWGSEGTGGTGGSTGSGDGGGGGGGGGGCTVGTGGAANHEGASSNTTTQASGGRSCSGPGYPFMSLGATGGLGGVGGGPANGKPGEPGAPGYVVITYPTLTLAKSPPSPALVVGANSVYTLTVTNTNTTGLNAWTARVVDQLPPNMTYVGSSGARWSCSPAANASGTLVTCDFEGKIDTDGGTAVLQITARPTNHFTVINYAAVDPIGSTSPPVPTTCTAANTPAGCAAPVTSAVPVTVSGYAYGDLNHNSARDAGEIAAGTSTRVKLTTRNGSVCDLPSPTKPALDVATIATSPGSGAFSFTNVAQGDYCLLMQKNGTPTSDAPGYPTGYVGTENGTGVIQFTVSSGEVPLQNFGLYRGSRLAGTVFADNGAGGGTANNGVKDGTEAGLAGVTVILAQNGTEWARAVSSSTGMFVLWQPSLVVSPATITPVLPAGYTATGGSAGSLFAGSYTRPTANFSLASGRDLSDIAFGMVAPNTLAPNGAQAAQPGTAVFYAHTYTAASGGQVTFTLANAASPADSGWSQVIYQDSNCDAVLQTSEPVITASMTVTAGQKVCLIVKQYVPAGASPNAQNAVALSAAFSYTGAAPALGIGTVVATDVTTVNQGGDLTLSKLVANLTQVTQYLTSVPARPGDSLQYRLAATNVGAKPLSSLVVNDFTPAFTNFFSAACPGALPAGITGCSVTQPAVGAKGAVQWTFTGSLEPGKSMLFVFRVDVDQ